MRALAYICGTIILLGIGTLVGNHIHKCDCPKDLSRALKGCENMVDSVHKLLSEEEDYRRSCEYKFEKCVSILEGVD